MTAWNATVYAFSRRDLLRSRKMLFALAVSCIPLVLAILGYVAEASSRGPHDYYPVTGEVVAFLCLLVTLPLVCLLLAGGSIADEAEERTLSYLLVRPIPRRALFVSRTAAVAFWAVLLALFQVVSVFLADALAFASFGDPASDILISEGQHIGVVATLWLNLPAALLVASLAAVLYTAMFCAISIIFTRYHFFANLVWFGVWELGFGLSHLPVAWLSANHNLRITVSAISPSVDDASITHGATHWFGLPLALLMVWAWWWVGVRVMERRDFHITSATT